MHKLGWKSNYFKSSDVSMLGNFLVFHNILSFMTEIKNVYQILPRPYVGSYSGENSHQFFAGKLDYCISKISWNICYGVNKLNAKYKILA